MPDIFLRAGEPNANDIRMWDGTVGSGDRVVDILVVGGGIVTLVSTGAHTAMATITGGGVATLTAAKGAAFTVSATGGGDVLVNGSKAGKGSVAITGGGKITIEYARSDTPLTLVIEIGGNPARHEPEWTPAMDDELVMTMLVVL